MRDKICRLPLEIIELDTLSYHIMVEGQINGIPCHLIIDTGASRTVFDRNYFENDVEILEDRTDDLLTAGLLASNIESVIANAATFSMAGFTLKNLRIILIDLTSINGIYKPVTGKNIHGLLGSDFLLNHGAVIDFENRSLALHTKRIPIG